MLRSRFMACAETILRDAETQQVSLIGMVEHITAPGVPVIVPRLSFYLVFDRDASDPATFECGLEMTIARMPVGGCKFALVFAAALSNRAIIHVTDLVVPVRGTLRAVVSQGGSTITGMELPVL